MFSVGNLHLSAVGKMQLSVPPTVRFNPRRRWLFAVTVHHILTCLAVIS